jgi:thymidylate synthase (FAD)
VAKEVARMVLPLTTQTTLYMKGSLRSWIHYANLRSSKDTQKEHRVIAEQIKSRLIELFPNVSIALGWKKEEKLEEDY